MELEQKEVQKYVILADGRVRVFPKESIHAFQVCGCPEKDCLGRAISAGFWDGEKTYGESTTLGVKSHPEDAELILEAAKNPNEL